MEKKQLLDFKLNNEQELEVYKKALQYIAQRAFDIIMDACDTTLQLDNKSVRKGIEAEDAKLFSKKHIKAMLSGTFDGMDVQVNTETFKFKNDADYSDWLNFFRKNYTEFGFSYVKAFYDGGITCLDSIYSMTTGYIKQIIFPYIQNFDKIPANEQADAAFMSLNGLLEFLRRCTEIWNFQRTRALDSFPKDKQIDVEHLTKKQTITNPPQPLKLQLNNPFNAPNTSIT